MFVLPAGEVKLAVGVEDRFEHFKFAGMNFNATASAQPLTTPRNAKREIRSAYAELLVPVMGGDFQAPGLRKLDFSLAIRNEEYSDFGRATSPKLGIVWTLFEGFQARGSWGRSFRAPTLYQRNGPISYVTGVRPDPQSPTGLSNTLQVSGTNPDLEPERARTFSLGVDWRPLAVPNLRLSATYYQIRYGNRIAALAPGDLSQLLARPDIYGAVVTRNPSAETVLAAYNSGFFVSGVQYPPNTIVALVDARPKNLSAVRLEGIDYAASYRRPIGSDTFEAFASAANIFKYRVARIASMPALSLLDQIGNPQRLRAKGGFNWFQGATASGITVNYSGDYSNTTVTPAQNVKAWTTLDLHTSVDLGSIHDWSNGVRIALDIQNLTNKSPPRLANVAARLAFDPDAADPIGRMISVSVTKQW